MPDADHLDGISAALSEHDAPVSNAQAVARRMESLKLPDIARAGLHEPGNALQNVQRGLLIDAA